jgi:RHS repeat-associated protein
LAGYFVSASLVSPSIPAPIKTCQVSKTWQVFSSRLATRVDGDLYYFIGDHLGSTSLVADAQGNEVGRILYDPYGDIVLNTLPFAVTDRLFTGYKWNDTMGLYDANARFYDPTIGGFTQMDSLVADHLDPRVRRIAAVTSLKICKVCAK